MTRITRLRSLWMTGLLLFGSLTACKTTQSTRMPTDTLSYLALGDSYTIGEGVGPKDTYPEQLRALLSVEKIKLAEPLIIARTGWTTDELSAGIDDAEIAGQTYALVTLLIGVNNQYRGRAVEDYAREFEQLLDRAIAFAGGREERVFVLSIPDWGVTPFAEEREVDRQAVAAAIDAYNAQKRAICAEKGVHFTDITETYRQIGAEVPSLVSDKLHPSALVYARWAKALVDPVAAVLRGQQQ